MLAVYDRQIRQNAKADGPGAKVERRDGVVRHVAPDHGWNGVVWSELDETTADAAIAAQVRYFGALGREFEWKLYAHDLPPDLPDRLRAAGFTSEPPETLMVAPVDDLPTGIALPVGVHLRTETDATAVDLMSELHQQVFGTDDNDVRHQLLTQIEETPERLAIVVAMAGDMPVSAARMETYPGTDFVGLWGGGTLPEWRGRGIYRALVAHRVRVAADRGFRYLQVDASDMSRPILQRLGFVPLTVTTPFMFRP
jgi:GNAT superfamily N-acetyltransferase